MNSKLAQNPCGKEATIAPAVARHHKRVATVNRKGKTTILPTSRFCCWDEAVRRESKR
jgi:hypothetical protein